MQLRIQNLSKCPVSDQDVKFESVYIAKEIDIILKSESILRKECICESVLPKDYRVLKSESVLRKDYLSEI